MFPVFSVNNSRSVRTYRKKIHAFLSIACLDRWFFSKPSNGSVMRGKKCIYLCIPHNIPCMVTGRYFRSQRPVKSDWLTFQNAGSFVLCYTKQFARRGHCSFYRPFKRFGSYFGAIPFRKRISKTP